MDDSKITLNVELKPYLQVYGDGSGGRCNSKRWVADRIPVNGDIFECCGCIFKIAMKGLENTFCDGGSGRYNTCTVEGYILKTDGVTFPEAKDGMDFRITLNVLAVADNEGLKIKDNVVVVDETVVEPVDETL